MRVRRGCVHGFLGLSNVIIQLYRRCDRSQETTRERGGAYRLHATHQSIESGPISAAASCLI